MNLRIVSLNCWLIDIPVVGGKDLRRRLSLLPSRLAALDADLICLQEVWHPKIAKAIASSLDASGYAYRYYDPRNLGSGLMVLSRRPFGAVEFMPHQERARGLEQFLRKGVMRFRWAMGNLSIEVINAHLGCAITDRARFVQLSRIADRWIGDGPTILLGDLNFPPFRPPNTNKMADEYCLATEKLGFIDCMAEADPAARATLGAKNPYVTGSWKGMTVDYILYRNLEPLRPTSARVVFDNPVDTAGERAIFLSDHFGVCATFGS